MRPLARPSRGVALIVIVLLIAIALVIVATLIESSQLAEARTRNLMREQQAAFYARGLEAWAKGILERDQLSGPGDSIADLWAQPLPPVDVPGGRLSGVMRDQNGCLNINALVFQDRVDAITHRRFLRLTDELRLNHDLVDSLVDWIDEDGVPLPRGAEDSFYLAQNPPYRSAGQPMVDLSELRLVRGVDARVFERLSPHVCALPNGAPINLNTAPPAVWVAVVPNMTLGQAENFSENGRGRYADVAAIEAKLLGLNLHLDNPRQINVVSTHFLAQADIELDGIPFRYYFRFERAGELTRVDRRSRGVF